jgi:uncharacterized lipoprotein YehR (DUF1307 family)
MKKVNKLFYLLVAFILVIASFTGCGSNKKESGNDSKIYRTLDEIKESGTIKIGVTKTHLVMWMKTEIIRDMMFILQNALLKI